MNPIPSDLEDRLPLTPAVFHILLALAKGPMHGYAIMKEIESITDSQMEIGPGTLYGAIKRLLEDGLIEETGAPPGEDLDDRPRRYYRLTTPGEVLLRAEVARLEKVLRAARQQPLLRGAR